MGCLFSHRSLRRTRVPAECSCSHPLPPKQGSTWLSGPASGKARTSRVVTELRRASCPLKNSKTSFQLTTIPCGSTQTMTSRPSPRRTLSRTRSLTRSRRRREKVPMRVTRTMTNAQPVQGPLAREQAPIGTAMLMRGMRTRRHSLHLTKPFPWNSTSTRSLSSISD